MDLTILYEAIEDVIRKRIAKGEKRFSREALGAIIRGGTKEEKRIHAGTLDDIFKEGVRSIGHEEVLDRLGKYKEENLHKGLSYEVKVLGGSTKTPTGYETAFPHELYKPEFAEDPEKSFQYKKEIQPHRLAFEGALGRANDIAWTQILSPAYTVRDRAERNSLNQFNNEKKPISDAFFNERGRIWDEKARAKHSYNVELDKHHMAAQKVYDEHMAPFSKAYNDAYDAHQKTTKVITKKYRSILDSATASSQDKDKARDDYYKELDTSEREVVKPHEDAYYREKNIAQQNLDKYMEPHRAVYDENTSRIDTEYDAKLKPFEDKYDADVKRLETAHFERIKPATEIFRQESNKADEFVKNTTAKEKEKYDTIKAGIDAKHGITSLSNYQEHIAISEASKKHADTAHQAWQRYGAPEFEVETSDTVHEGKKALYVHEIQSDLHKNVPNASDMSRNWHEHALNYIKKYAKEGGYHHVIIAPHSVHYSNTGGHLPIRKFRASVENISMEEQDKILGNVKGMDVPNKVAYKYRKEIIPMAEKVFEQPAQRVEMGYRGARGNNADVDNHAFNVFNVDQEEKTEA